MCFFKGPTLKFFSHFYMDTLWNAYNRYPQRSREGQVMIPAPLPLCVLQKVFFDLYANCQYINGFTNEPTLKPEQSQILKSLAFLRHSVQRNYAYRQLLKIQPGKL